MTAHWPDRPFKGRRLGIHMRYFGTFGIYRAADLHDDRQRCIRPMQYAYGPLSEVGTLHRLIENNLASRRQFRLRTTYNVGEFNCRFNYYLLWFYRRSQDDIVYLCSNFLSAVNALTG